MGSARARQSCRAGAAGSAVGDPGSAGIPVVVLSGVAADQIHDLEAAASFNKPVSFPEVVCVVVVLADKGNIPGGAAGDLYVSAVGSPLPLRAVQTGPERSGGSRGP